MKKALVILCFLAVLCLPVSAHAVGPLMVQAHTATWNRNVETDLAGYYVYYRPVTSPVTAWDNSRRSASVPQPAGTTLPVYNLLTIITVNGNYEIMVTAYDTAGNESGPSNIVPFAVDLPSAPVNAHITTP